MRIRYAQTDGVDGPGKGMGTLDSGKRLRFILGPVTGDVQPLPGKR